ncbi:ATP-dependent helicase HrpB [Paenibacillus sp. YPG26]|uniref:ATP-dependent helicase HrpB n=1 Tax=Paenibacillus sp. YPG26 TaxID=2878915 RepID=UPI00203C0446|nr:ATP-dependent helicase HrpB [Paenibacillus sp. YPG26]USB31979.1 ATP-dependent helicase HrpB [Paenibacillus sp. YPG26]
MKSMNLPIDEIIPDMKEALNKSNCAVLLAEPGAGKTTRTPLALLGEPWLKGQGIIMLEPRRLAARSAAAFMAAQLGEEVGGTVGYRIRMDSRTSQRTRITVVTEGILTRMLQADPGLEGTGLIIFDEYHERNLQADLGLAITLQSQSILREDLRILVMSATLAAEPVSRLMNYAPVLQSKGRVFPVETFYSEPSSHPLELRMTGAIHSALSRHEGGILAFLPGVREIRRVQMSLTQGLPPDVDVVPLYGSMPQTEQYEAIRAPQAGRRKVVLATSIAESSLTVEGIRVVIDSGLRRTQQFSARTGMGRLVTIRAARDSADQRRGRAGRTAPGICYRLWTEQEDRQLPETTSPEILEADLSGVALELAVWGVKNPAELQWLDLPRAASIDQAQRLLGQLQALDPDGNITVHGRQMAALGLHPRLAHMLLAASGIGQGRLACLLAAILEDRDIFPRLSSGRLNNDLRVRLEVMTRAYLEGTGRTDLAGAHRSDVERLLTQGRQWIARLPETDRVQIDPSTEAADRLCGLLLSYAFPDRIAQRRMDGRYLLRSGRGAELANGEQMAQSRYIVAAEVDDEGIEARILLAAPLTESQLEHHFREEMNEELDIKWDDGTGSVRAKSMIKLGAIVFKETANIKPSGEQIQMALLKTIQDNGLDLLPWDAKSRQLQARIQFMREHCGGDWPDVSNDMLQQNAREWLGPYIDGFKKKSDFRALRLYQILEHLLNWSQRQELEEQAPTHITVPSGSRIAVNYEGPQAPYAAVRLQELFGLMDTPRLAYGRAVVTLHILSPASRPVQVTSDLRSFWEHTYFEVKKDLKGRYPKHYWPDDPLEATATRRVRPPGNRK